MSAGHFIGHVHSLAFFCFNFTPCAPLVGSRNWAYVLNITHRWMYLLGND
jgi:hypothetical protein